MVTANIHHTANFDVAGNSSAQGSFARDNDVSDQVAQELEHATALMRDSVGVAVHWPATAAGLYHLDTGGSRLRARLALLSGMAYGASSAHRIAAAAAAELVHNASLVHDDLCDGDVERRGKPAVWRKESPGVALCTGDLLLTAAFRAALNSDLPEHRLALVELLTDRVSQVIAGQSIELASPETTTHATNTLDHYLQATLAKTAPLIVLPLEAGAAGGELSDEQHQRLGRFANAVGLAYQIIDDLDDVDLQCAQRSSPGYYHRYHAWPRHWPWHTPNHTDPASTAMLRAVRHAAGALSRASGLIHYFPNPLSAALSDMLAKLNQRLVEHRLASASRVDTPQSESLL